jgi:hypothetical protein
MAATSDLILCISKHNYPAGYKLESSTERAAAMRSADITVYGCVLICSMLTRNTGRVPNKIAPDKLRKPSCCIDRNETCPKEKKNSLENPCLILHEANTCVESLLVCFNAYLASYCEHF